MKKLKIKLISLGIACLLGVGGAITAASAFNVDKPFEEVRADDTIQYISRSWDDTNKKVVDTPSTCETYKIVNSGQLTWSTGWYVLKSNVTFEDSFEPIIINGNDVNLILMDGYTLTVKSYIAVNSGNTLNIYSQSGGTGALNVAADEEMGPGSDAAGIGGGYQENGGNVTVYGGNITANSSHGAGIGGGYWGDGGSITIYGGNIRANGGVYGAGIGGGWEGNGGNVTVYGGNIIATGGEDATGIGGGRNGDGGTVNILGGTVVANGGDSGIGIGAGLNNSNHGTLTINETSLVVFGGNTANPTTERSKTEYDAERWRYMTVKSNLEPVNYVSRSWDSTNKVVVETPSTCDFYKLVKSDSTSWENDKWYVLNESIEINNRIEVTGTVNLILCDGATLTANDGISVNEGNTLNIYGQSEGENAGKLIASTPSEVDHDAVIGGDSDFAAGTINIHGGNIDATPSGYGAAIGGGLYKEGGNITIYGGNIDVSTSSYGAAIGGGHSGAAGNITIYGGDITASSYYGAAIGGGAYYNGTDGDITINGGNINAQCYSYGAAIGGGDCSSSGNIVINGGEINAQCYGYGSGAGIGGGNEASAKTIIINNGSITATGGKGAGIGSGGYAAGGDITINGGTIIASSRYGAGIGGGQEGDGGNIVIKNGNITAYGGNGGGTYSETAAGIGGGYNSAGANITIYDGDITATGGKGSVGIGAGQNNTSHGTLTIVDETKLSVYGGNSYKSFSPIEKVNDDYERLTYMRVRFPHNHVWSYVADGNVISATCSAEDCYVLEAARTLTLVAEDSIFDGTAKSISFAPGYSAEAFATPTISYFKDGDEVDECINVGTYEARVTIGEVTAIKEFTIAQATPTPDTPTGLAATYGDKLSSVTLPLGWAWKVPTDEVGDVGDRTHVAIYTPTDPNYKAIEANVTISVAQATPTPDIPTGLAATYGDELSSVTLPSGWAWKNPEVSVGDAGERVHVATFTPTDPNYKEIEADVTISVAQATPTPEVPTGLAATYGDKLSSVDLPTNWSWKVPTDEVGVVGDRTHVAVYTPTDPNYKAIEANVTISVAQATPTPDIPTGLAATYGDKLSSVTLPLGWAWKNPEASVGDAGERVHVATFTPTDPNYKAIEANVTISVAQATPTPDIPTGLAATYGDELSSVTLPSGWAWKNPEVSVGDAGERVHVATFTPTDPNYKEIEADVTISVAQATPTPEVPTGLAATYGDKLSSVALPINWSWKAPTDEVGGVGDRTHVAVYTPTDPNYKTIEANVTISVAQATPTPEVPTGLAATYGDKLSSVALPTNWAWKNPEDPVGDAGDRTHVAIYTPTDPNYKAIEANTVVSVAQATPTPEVPTGLAATYGDELSSVALPSGWAWKNPEDPVGNAGERVHVATFTPTGPNYKAKDENITIIVAKANPSVPTLDAIEAPCDVALSTIGLPEGFSWMDGAQKTSTLGENTFKVRYTPVDTANYNVVDNIDLKVNVEWKLVDTSSSSVSIVIDGADEAYTTNTSVKVEVKADISVEQKHNEYAPLATKNFVKSNEDIVEIYNIRLIRTTNGVEEEIQPSDIKAGAKIIISMAIPENLVGKEFRLLHIHNAEDISEITNYSVSKDGKTLTVEVDRLSEMAFIGATDKDNGFIYSNGLPGWALALIIILAILTLGAAGLLIFLIMILLKKDNDEDKDENKGEAVAKSSALFLPALIVLSAGSAGGTAAIIVLSVLLVGILAADGFLFYKLWKKNEPARLAKKEAEEKARQEEEAKKAEEARKEEERKAEAARKSEEARKAEEAAAEEKARLEAERKAAEESQPASEEEDEVVTVKDEQGNVFQIRYVRSFQAKLSQAEGELKDYYNELKNHALSYRKANSRVSWHFESVNVGRAQALKFAIRGKTLCVYYALDAAEYADTKYKVEAVESKKFEDVPCLYRVKNERRLGYAKELIDSVMARLGIGMGEPSNADFRLPYESTEALLAKGLIKELRVNPKREAEPSEAPILSSVDVSQADATMSDEQAENAIEIETKPSRRNRGGKETINIDTLSENFADGDEVTLDALIEKKLVPAKTGYVKVLARGVLNKKLIVYLHDYSLQAVKMIVLLGGHAKRVQ